MPTFLDNDPFAIVYHEIGKRNPTKALNKIGRHGVTGLSSTQINSYDLFEPCDMHTVMACTTYRWKIRNRMTTNRDAITPETITRPSRSDCAKLDWMDARFKVNEFRSQPDVCLKLKKGDAVIPCKRQRGQRESR